MTHKPLSHSHVTQSPPRLSTRPPAPEHQKYSDAPRSQPVAPAMAPAMAILLRKSLLTVNGRGGGVRMSWALRTMPV